MCEKHQTEKQISTTLSALAENGRVLVAIAGPPGSGKTTFAQSLAGQLNLLHPGKCKVMSMDGFHLDDTYLEKQGWRLRKGAPFTYDLGGLDTMLKRLKNNEEDLIMVPVFDRTIEIARAGALAIPKSTSIVLVEGNYLLLDREPWRALQRYFDKTIMLKAPLETLRQRLQGRWQDLGLSAADIEQKLTGNDFKNVDLVIKTSDRADMVVETGSA